MGKQNTAMIALALAGAGLLAPWAATAPAVDAVQRPHGMGADPRPSPEPVACVPLLPRPDTGMALSLPGAAAKLGVRLSAAARDAARVATALLAAPDDGGAADRPATSTCGVRG